MIWSFDDVAGHGAQQPVAPREGLVVVAATHQRLERERGVAQPAEAVVPVAIAPERLGQRGGRRGHDAARRVVGQGLQRDERAHHGVLVRALVAALGGPFRPVGLGQVHGVVAVERRRRLLVRGMPHQRERIALVRGDREVGDRAHVLAHGVDPVPERHRIRTGGQARQPVVRGDPGDAPRRSRSAPPAPCASRRCRSRPRRNAPGAGWSSRTGMQSVTRTVPVAVSYSVSTTRVSGRYQRRVARMADGAPAGAIFQ